MIEITVDDLLLVIDESKLTTLNSYGSEKTRQTLARVWEVDVSDLMQYQAIFFDKGIELLSDKDSFVTLSFISHGYVADAQEFIDATEAQKQIEIDLEIINRESQWSADESIYFDQWWPQPKINLSSQTLEFGIALKDFHQQVFNRTLNRVLLTRYGHISLNYSLSESAIRNANPLSFYQGKLDEIASVMEIADGYKYKDVDEDNDMPSRSRLINLILSSEIF